MKNLKTFEKFINEGKRWNYFKNDREAMKAAEKLIKDKKSGDRDGDIHDQIAYGHGMDQISIDAVARFLDDYEYSSGRVSDVDDYIGESDKKNK